MARIIVIETTSINPWEDSPEWELCLQYCEFPPNGDRGYRFIYQVEGRLRPQRGGARIPSRAIADHLWEQATLEGWGNHEHL